MEFIYCSLLLLLYFFFFGEDESSSYEVNICVVLGVPDRRLLDIGDRYLGIGDDKCEERYNRGGCRSGERNNVGWGLLEWM